MGVQLLKDIYLFKEFLPKELDELSAKGSVKTYNQGDTIFDEGDKAQSLFVIRHGTVHIRRPGKQDDVDLVKLGGVPISVKCPLSTTSHARRARWHWSVRSCWKSATTRCKPIWKRARRPQCGFTARCRISWPVVCVRPRWT